MTTTQRNEIKALLADQGFAKVLEEIADQAGDQADDIRDTHHANQTSLENDLSDSLRMVHLRGLADRLEAPIAHAIDTLESPVTLRLVKNSHQKTAAQNSLQGYTK